MKKLIYFDNAATTYPKPQRVINEVARCMKSYCGNPGRGGHRLSRLASEKVYECRCLIAGLYGSSKPENVIFTRNTTEALNLAIKAFMRKGDRAVISGLEHNSVFRPVTALADFGCRYTIFGIPSTNPDEIFESFKMSVRPGTRLVVVTHISNICGIRMPVEKIGRFCRERGIFFIIDDAQGAGSLTLDIGKCGADVICAPGHKGLYGPQGSGFALFSDRWKYEELILGLSTFMEGGNGVNSLEDHMPPFLPERFEAGTLATPCIAGLAEGIKAINAIGTDAVYDHACRLRRRLIEMLSSNRKITIYAPDADCGSIVLFNCQGFHPDEVASSLDKAGICVRSGYHCSPLAHETLSTGGSGALRVSFSIFNTSSEIEVFYRRLCEIISV